LSGDQLLSLCGKQANSATRSCARPAAIIRCAIRERVGGVPLCLVERGQIVQRYPVSDGWHRARLRGSSLRAGTRLGVGVAALPFVEIGEIVQRATWMIAPEHFRIMSEPLITGSASAWRPCTLSTWPILLQRRDPQDARGRLPS
jgi:hypothetical protein